jgi:hypothetical protein
VRSFAGRGVCVSLWTVWGIYDRCELSFKKSVYASEQDRPDVAAARERWRINQRLLDPSRLVFIDETGTSTNMAKLRGPLPAGQTPDRQGPARPLEDHHLRGRAEMRRHHRAVRDRQADEQRDLSPLIWNNASSRP